MRSELKSSRLLPIALVVTTSLLIAVGIIYNKYNPITTTDTTPSLPGGTLTGGSSPSPSPESSIPATTVASPSVAPSAALPPVNLTVDANGLSKATIVMNTSQGVIRFKFYPNDAPNTVARIIELIQKGFYNDLAFHRVVPGFVIQGGDPLGNGTGGSGQKLKAEFNSRRHVEGTVAMARAADPDSADSQFYISLGTHPHLDRSYTVFGQVVEGLDVARKIKAGDKMTSVTIE